MEQAWKRLAAEQWINNRIDWKRRRKAPEGFDQAARDIHGLLRRVMVRSDGDELLPELQAIFSDDFIDANPRWGLLLLGWAWGELDPQLVSGASAMAAWLEERAKRLIQEHHAVLPRPATLAREHANTGFFPGSLRGWFESAEAGNA